ncbi:MAG TPA: S41 family peptidase [Vicinamibacterales bacterium]|nr:S41 family peptidase [Vicinamibacterales bacterium]
MLTMLREINDDVAKHYYDRSFHGIDLEARYKAAGLRLETVAGFNDGIATLAEFLTQFDDSHTAFLPPQRRARVNYGWQMAMVGDVPRIIDVDAGSDAAAKGLAPGDRVLLLNTVEPNRQNLWRLLYFYRYIRPQAQQHVSVLKPDGSARTVDVVSRVTDKPVTEVGDLIAEIEDTLARARDVGAAIGADIFVWKMAVFGNPDRVDEMIGKARGCKTLILDLRGNGGGAVDALRELVSRSFDREVFVALEKQRGRDVKEIARPARNAFTGRLIVLVDSRSASAAEMFARIVQIETRGTVLGDRTAGAVMTSHLFTHKAGLGGIAVYAVSVTVGDVRMSDGTSLEKIGVAPDEILLPSATDLASGRDPVLAYAIEIAGGSISAEQAGRLFK